MSAIDPQFAAAQPSAAVTAAIQRPGLRLTQVMQTVMEGYAERPALGQRAVEFVNDPQTGRTLLKLLPRFETITYRELWRRVGTLANAWTHEVVPGGRALEDGSGFQTYHVMNPYDEGIGLDEYVDWLVEAGYSIERIADYSESLRRFETALRGLPEKQRNASLLPLLHNYQKPQQPATGSMAPTDRFRAAVQDAKTGPGKAIPHITPAIIAKYVNDLRLLELL
ncbi:hypothetical protein A5659_01360 [Mycobacterium sp. 1165196.3]|nr:hypothetical protein A5659_01360 [Mycobacterium sp. 1165196.3]